MQIELTPTGVYRTDHRVYRDSDIYALSAEEQTKIKAEIALREESEDVAAVNAVGFSQCPNVASK